MSRRYSLGVPSGIFLISIVHTWFNYPAYKVGVPRRPDRKSNTTPEYKQQESNDVEVYVIGSGIDKQIKVSQWKGKKISYQMNVCLYGDPTGP